MPVISGINQIVAGDELIVTVNWYRSPATISINNIPLVTTEVDSKNLSAFIPLGGINAKYGDNVSVRVEDSFGVSEPEIGSYLPPTGYQFIEITSLGLGNRRLPDILIGDMIAWSPLDSEANLVIINSNGLVDFSDESEYGARFDYIRLDSSLEFDASINLKFIKPDDDFFDTSIISGFNTVNVSVVDANVDDPTSIFSREDLVVNDSMVVYYPPSIGGIAISPVVENSNATGHFVVESGIDLTTLVYIHDLNNKLWYSLQVNLLGRTLSLVHSVELNIPINSIGYVQGKVQAIEGLLLTPLDCELSNDNGLTWSESPLPMVTNSTLFRVLVPTGPSYETQYSKSFRINATVESASVISEANPSGFFILNDRNVPLAQLTSGDWTTDPNKEPVILSPINLSGVVNRVIYYDLIKELTSLRSDVLRIIQVNQIVGGNIESAFLGKCIKALRTTPGVISAQVILADIDANQYSLSVNISVT